MVTDGTREPHVEMARFGRDHWSTLLYIETLCTDHRGQADRRRMRCHANRHPHLSALADYEWTDGTSYPTRLANGETLADHDDWDCADDLEAAGLIKIHGTGANPFFAMTDAGRVEANRLRAERQNRNG